MGVKIEMADGMEIGDGEEIEMADGMEIGDGGGDRNGRWYGDWRWGWR